MSMSSAVPLATSEITSPNREKKESNSIVINQQGIESNDFIYNRLRNKSMNG